MSQEVCGMCRMLPIFGSYSSVRNNCNRTAVTRAHRFKYVRTYPTMLVMPDGATITVRYKEPRKIIKLPEDISQLSEAERTLRLARRKPREKIVIQEELEDSFDVNQYRHLWKKK